MTNVVFLGPSLPLAEARQTLPDTTFLPPARQADVVSAVGIYRPKVIALVDGVFGQSLSVWHKELLFALEHGVRVIGAASMGALRAAELAPFGMEGVGTVFEYFMSGPLTDDDEVAVAYMPIDEGFQPVSHAMVNLRATFARAADMQIIERATARRLIQASKRLNFAERCLPAISKAADLATDEAYALNDFFAAHYVDVKAGDVRKLLSCLKDAQREPRISRSTARSPGFDYLYDNDRTVLHNATEVSLRAIGVRAALHHSDFNDLTFDAMNRVLVQVLAQKLGVEATAEEITAEETRFRRRRALTQSDFEEWLVANDLSMMEFTRLMRELAVCRRLHRWLLGSHLSVHQNRWLLDELRLRDRYSATADDTAGEVAVIGSAHGEAESLAEMDDSILTDLLPSHQRATAWSTHAPLAAWLEEAGFKDLKDLAFALRREQLLRDTRARQHTGGDTEQTEDKGKV